MQDLIPSLSGRKRAIRSRAMLIAIAVIAIILKEVLFLYFKELKSFDYLFIAAANILFLGSFFLPVKITMTASEVHGTMRRVHEKVIGLLPNNLSCGTGFAVYGPLALLRNQQPYNVTIESKMGESNLFLITSGDVTLFSREKKRFEEEEGEKLYDTYKIS